MLPSFRKIFRESRTEDEEKKAKNTAFFALCGFFVVIFVVGIARNSINNKKILP